MPKPLFAEMEIPLPPIERWPDEVRYRYEERAGIAEFDGNATREEAESIALAEVRELWANSDAWMW